MPMTPPRQKRRPTPQNYSQGRSRAANIGKRGLFHCNYCQKDITGVVRIKCAECPDFDLCLDCFSVGVEITPHQKDHAYRVMDCLSFPLFHPDWGADEEQLLLEAIDMAGFGNWTAVSEHVGSKTKEECKGHYFDIYVNSPTFPEPWPAPQMAGVDPIAHQKAKQARLRQQEQQTAASAAGAGLQGGSMGMHESMAAESGVQQAKRTAVSTDAETAHGPAKRIKLDPTFQSKGDTTNDGSISHDHVQHQQAAASGVSDSSAADYNADAAEATREAGGETDHVVGEAIPRETGSKHLNHNREAAQTDNGPNGHPTVAGGLPHHPTTAGGASAADLQEGEAGESTPNLASSSRVPAGHMDHGLPAEGLRMHTDGMVTEGVTEGVTGNTASGRAAVNASNASQALNKKAAHDVVALAGFHIKRQEFEPEYDNEAEMIVADMEFKEDDTEEDVEEKVRVIEYYNTRLTERERRRHFVMDRKLINVRKQQNLDRRRSPAERELYARLKALARYLPQPEFEVLSDGIVTETRLRARIQELKEYRRAGIRTFADAEVYEADKKRKSTVQPTLSTHPPGSLAKNWQYGFPSADSSLQGWGATLVARTASATVLPPTRKSSGTPTMEGLRGAASALAAWRARRGVALDITALPGMAVLSAKERELCAQARLLPVHYLELKALMMREGQTKGYISRQEARSFFRLEPAKAVRVYELLLSSGWIPGPPAAAMQAPTAGGHAANGGG
ncbi:hypothetical protein ABBQ32_002810 [Trebouxia sp. C0010 RCD-2024]